MAKRYNKRYLEKVNKVWEIRGEKKGPAHYIVDTRAAALEILVKINDFDSVDEITKGKLVPINIDKFRNIEEKEKYKKIETKKRKLDYKVEKSKKESKKINDAAKKMISEKEKVQKKFTRDQLDKKRMLNKEIKKTLSQKLNEASVIKNEYEIKMQQLKAEQEKLEYQLHLKSEKEKELKENKEKREEEISKPIKQKVSEDIKKLRSESYVKKTIVKQRLVSKLDANGNLAVIEHEQIGSHARSTYSIRSFGKFPATLLSVSLVFVAIAILYMISLLVII